jgi:DNA-binding MarR family transcriptional regulator
LGQQGGIDVVSKIDKPFSLWVLVQQTRDAIYNARNKELAKHDISVREAATLHGIVSLGPMATPAKLARWTYRKPHTIAAILNRMQRKGLIKLTKDLEIKNLVRISLTEEGKRIYKDILKRTSIHRAFKTLDDEICRQLEVGLTRIRDAALKQTGDSIQRPFP